MSKNIVICCDGTSNEPAQDMTNVVKLYFTLINDPQTQVTYYHPGVGTMEPPGALTWYEKLWTITLGLALGRGIQDDIRDAYVFLSDRFEPGDRVFLFGFSRGAYTARALAGLLKMYGLLMPGNAPLAPYAIRMMFTINQAEWRDDQNTAAKVFALAERFRGTFTRDCKPYFIGLWDTVSSVGWVAHPTHLPYTANNPDVQIARHAVAIDERRAFFPVNLWRPRDTPPSGPQDLIQVWFPGGHGDVGGGHPEGNQSAQSKYALGWILDEAQKAGILVDQAKANIILGLTAGSKFQPASPQFALHEKIGGWWRLAEFLPKPFYDYGTRRRHWRANLFRRRAMPSDAYVHESAYLRGPEYARRLPPSARRYP